jgi:hypothetical protein
MLFMDTNLLLRGGNGEMNGVAQATSFLKHAN